MTVSFPYTNPIVAGKQIYRCEQSGEEWVWKAKTQNGVSISYLDLVNKPRLNGVVISGEKTLPEFGIMPDFRNIHTEAVLSDDCKVAIGIGKEQVCFTTLGELRAYLEQTTPASAAAGRQAIAICGKQNGTNTHFTLEQPYVPGSSALYLNGQRLYPDIDYEEADGAFSFLETPPKATDRLLFEAIIRQQ